MSKALENGDGVARFVSGKGKILETAYEDFSAKTAA
jgi:hypothetical protein